MQTRTTPPIPPGNFDQIVKGNVHIKKLNKYNYKIKFSKIDDFLLYKVGSDSSQSSTNKDRLVYYENAKEWITKFNTLNDSSKPIFTPTTVMSIGSKFYIFVINKAKINKDEHVVFKVSTEEINLVGDTPEKMLKLPQGHYDNVRFDIDNGPWCLMVPANYPISIYPFGTIAMDTGVGVNSFTIYAFGYNTAANIFNKDYYWWYITNDWWMVACNEDGGAVLSAAAFTSLYGYTIINSTSNHALFFSSWTMLPGFVQTELSGFSYLFPPGASQSVPYPDF